MIIRQGVVVSHKLILINIILMARTKLIAKYSALNTPNLPQRIYDEIKTFIVNNGIEDLPQLEICGRWTGKLAVSNGGWRGDFDFLYPILRMCRVDRHGDVYPDMSKIMECVADWTEYLTTPDEYDDELGASDETFRDSDYLADDVNDFRSAAYAAEIGSFLDSDEPDMLSHDRALAEIDSNCCGETEAEEGGRIFQEGFNVTRINSAEDFLKLMEAMETEVAEGGGMSWTSPDFDMAEIESMFENTEDSGPTWMEFIDDLRNGRYGDLPEDYDGLSEPEEDAADRSDK